MDGKKIYQIEINGLKESIDQIESLRKQLDMLSAQIDAFEKKTISIKVDMPSTQGVSTNSSSSNSTRNTSSLSEEEKIAKQIEQIDAKREAYSKEIYQNYLAAKDVLKETVNDQKQLAAAERMQASQYTNTMQGMKQELSDIKQVMQTVDLGDTEKFKQLTDRANELNEKLLEIEKSYGQFGRQVGNYQDAANGFNKINIVVGGVTREFANAREASRELSNELKTMAINGQQDTKEFKELQKTVAKLTSDIKDATVSSQAMDTMLDTMQSITAMASVGKGFGALFGIDNDEIDKSIQKLVALQNAMQGLEKIRQQMNSGEFLGGTLSKANAMIDAFAEKVMGASKAQQTLATTANAAKTSSQGLAAAETAQAAATTTATVATKALSVALKAIGIGLVISLVSTLITYWEEIYDWFTDTIPALKNLGEWFNKLVPILSGVGTALVKWIVAPIKLAAEVIAAVINGDFKNLPKIVSNSLKDSYNVVENYQKGHQKAVENQQEKHLKKMRDKQLKANEEAEKDAEAKYGKDYNRTQKHYKDQIALLDENLKKTKKGSDEYKKIEEQRRDYQRKVWESERSERETVNKKRLADSKKSAKEIADAENELAKLKIENMKEGLRKTITQLEEERKARLAKVRQNGHMTRELEAEINKLYDTKIEEEKKKHAEAVENTYKDMWRNILAAQIKYQEREVDILKTSDKLYEDKLNRGTDKMFNQNISSYGIQGKNSYSPSTQASLGIKSTSNNEMIEDYKKLVVMLRETNTAENYLKVARLTRNEELERLERERTQIDEETYNARKQLIENEVELTEKSFNVKKKAYDDYDAFLKQKYSSQLQQAQAHAYTEMLLEEGYSRSLAQTFQQRIGAVEAYWKARINNEKINAEALLESQEELENKRYQQEKDAEDKAWKDQQDQQSKWFEKRREEIQLEAEDQKWSQTELDQELLNIDKDYNEAAEALYKAHTDNLAAIDKQHEQKMETLTVEKNDRIKNLNAEYYQDALQELRDFQTALSNLENRQPVYNMLGIVNLKETNKNNKELLEGYEKLAQSINEKRLKLNNDFKNGLIDKNAFQSSLREMDSFAADLGDKMDNVKYQLSFGGQWEMMAQGINQWVQMVGQGISQVMSSLSEITQNQYEAQIAQQEEYINKYEELLQKQEDITKEHADKVNDIEDELKNARGDRRQQLIDQLNAEMAAQRASLSQEKKIEKEKEKAEREKKKLEHDQAVAKKRMDVAQAYINMAMAISMAAVNKWPLPAIPMMALAAAAGAAQIAAIQSQNIPSYGSGGLLEGKSHRDGGIKTSIGKSPIELEGQEYVIRKKSSVTNLPVLDFINRSERKLNLGDFIDFYSSKKLKNNIVSASPKARYESGGQVIPSLRNDFEFNDRLVDTMEAYANRPVWVAVTDIEDAQANVNYVRTLSGMKN